MGGVVVAVIFMGLLLMDVVLSVKAAEKRFAVEEGLRREAQRKRKRAAKPAARPPQMAQKPPAKAIEPEPVGWLASDLTSALEGLGFKGPAMRDAVDRVLLVGARTLEDAIRGALKILRPPAPATKSPMTWVRSSAEYGAIHCQDERGETLGTVKRAGSTWTWSTQRSSGHAGSRFEAQRAVEMRV